MNVSPTTDTPERRRSSFGRLHQRGGTWYLRYRVGGTEHDVSTGTTNLEKAEKFRSRCEAQYDLGTLASPNVRRTTFEDLMQMVRDEYRARRRRSEKRLTGCIKHLTTAFAGRRALAITPDRLTTYVADRLAAVAAPPTIRNELNVLRHAFRLAKAARKVFDVPAFPKLAAAHIRGGFFEAPAFRRVLAELPDYLAGPMTFAYLTGWRVPSEVLKLEWRNIDFTAGVVRLEPGQTKNGEGRTFPFDVLPDLVTLLTAQRDRTRALERRLGRIVSPVFWRGDGIPIRDYYAAWHSACDRAAHEERDGVRTVVCAELVGRIPHDFRRTAVRNLVRAGVPEKTAMMLTGHKTRAVFDRYDIVNEADLRTAVRKLAEAARGTEGGQTAAAAGKGA
jgi:integrase